MWWPNLNDALEKIVPESIQDEDIESPDDKEVLSMIVNKLNQQEKLLNKMSSGYNVKNKEITKNDSTIIAREIDLVIQQLLKCNNDLEETNVKNDMYLYNSINKSITMLDKITRILRN